MNIQKKAGLAILSLSLISVYVVPAQSAETHILLYKHQGITESQWKSMSSEDRDLIDSGSWTSPEDAGSVVNSPPSKPTFSATAYESDGTTLIGSM